jgi:hypothetical protein
LKYDDESHDLMVPVEKDKLLTPTIRLSKRWCLSAEAASDYTGTELFDLLNQLPRHLSAIVPVKLPFNFKGAVMVINNYLSRIHPGV